MVIANVCGFNNWLLKLLPEYDCRQMIAVQPEMRSKKKPGGTVRMAVSKEKSTEGLPIGIQVVGSPFGERKVLRIMKDLEEKVGGYQPPVNFSAGGLS